MTDDTTPRETKLPQTVYLDGLPYTTEEQLQRRRERLAALGLPDDIESATTVKPERNSFAIGLNERGDIME